MVLSKRQRSPSSSYHPQMSMSQREEPLSMALPDTMPPAKRTRNTAGSSKAATTSKLPAKTPPAKKSRASRAKKVSALQSATPAVPVMPPAMSASSQDGSRRLNCLIEGESRVVVVTARNDFVVSDLQDEIQRRGARGTLKDVDSYNLELWKVDIGLIMDKDILSHLRVESCEGAEELAPWESVKGYWSSQPSTGRLHIIVKTSDTGKRAAPEPTDIVDRLKLTQLVTTAPSTTGKPNTYQRLQRLPSEKILDDRPEPDRDIPPIPLLYDGFGHFLDIMDGRNDVPGLADVEVLTLRQEVDDLARKMTGYFDTEDERRDAALPCLNSIFGARRGTNIPELAASAIGSIRTDGHNTADHGAGSIIVEFRNWMAGISSLPQIELVGYVARLDAVATDEVARRQLYLRWRVPCVGLTLVGCDITFYAVIAIDHRFRVVPLTPTLSCIQSASDGRDRTSLYSAFTAASLLQARILQDATALLNNPPDVIPALARHFPAVSTLRKYPASSGGYFNFEIQGFFPDRQSYRLLYVAEMPGSEKRVLVKFVRQYSIKLHEICAKSGRAPPILAFERLPGGWFAVAMEYIESGIPITHSKLLTTHRDRWMGELKKLVHSFHEEDLVHGDLRDANIICKDDSVMLIDFDWGGKEGDVSYPTSNLNPELLLGRMFGDMRITKEDDRRVLENTLAKLKAIHG